jgi:hypothetical protein
MAAGEYIINWTSPTKSVFAIQPNEINGPGQVNVNSVLKLHGRFTVNYGELIAENFIHLLENFAGNTEPAGALTSGMLWFDTTTTDGILKVRNNANNAWIVVGTGASGSGGGGAGSVPEIPPAGSFTAVSGKNYFINTSAGAVTVTLPLVPTVGDVIGFTDLTGSFDINNLIVSGNGKLIMGDPTNLFSDVKFSAFRLGYSGVTYGWRIVP